MQFLAAKSLCIIFLEDKYSIPSAIWPIKLKICPTVKIYKIKY